MVLEALTALSLAATIVQFVDFGSKLLAKGHEIYVSVDGASIENNDLEAATKNLRDLSGRLNVSAVSRRGDTVEATSEPEVALIQLTTKCSAVARELLTVLDHLKVQPGSNRKWKTFQQALKSSLKQSQVDEIKSRLQAIRQELSLSVLVSLRESIDLHAIRSNAGFLSLESSTRALADQLIREQQKALSDHTNFLRHGQDKATRIVEAQHHQTRREIIATIHNEWAGVPSRRIGGINGDDGDDENPMKRQLVSNLILESLRFQTMDDRCEEIESAHKRTFGWIFEDTSQERMWANFPKWLSTGTGIYWMNGKAASGKSTLMKYVSSDTRTKDLLGHWAGEQRLIQAAHYFWNSGTAEQRSHAGLLRALLFKALRQCESLLPDIFPEIWIDKMSKPLFIIEDMERISWTLPRLSEAFDRLVCTQSNGLKFCLFVDGLDEYEGDYFDVIKTFTKISQSSSVKVCLSSRPLFDFVAAFQSCQSLRLQDLTFSDIESYINDELGTNTHMQILREQKPQEAEMLVFEIVNKADGVFLWVKLVVLSMLRGLRQSDEIRDLQLRLTLLPPSLEDLFSHILRRLEPVYLEQSSRIFQIFAEAQNSDRPLTSLELSFAEELDFRAVIREPTRQLCMKELLEREAQIETWLRTRCGGLIETCSGVNAYGSFTDARLSYLHRTVRDFLELPEIWRIVLRPTSGRRFVPRVALVQAQMLYIKRVLPFPTDLIGQISDLQHVAKRAIAFAQNAETTTIKPQVMILDELDRVCNNLEDFLEFPCNWATSYDRLSSRKEVHVHQNSFLTLAIKTGLYFYVEQKLKLKPWLIKRAGRPLLQYAVSSENDLCIRDLRVNTDMVELLLRHGARVDEVYENTTAWDLVLESLWSLLYKRESESTVAMWLSVVKLFLEHGADPSRCIGNDPSKLAYSLVNALCDTPHEVKALLVSPGILAERAQKVSRTRHTFAHSRKKDSTDVTRTPINPFQRIPKTEELTLQSLEVKGQAVQNIANFDGSSRANGTEKGADILGDSEDIAVIEATSDSKSRWKSPGCELIKKTADSITQYQQQGLVQSQRQKMSLVPQHGIVSTIATDQTGGSGSSKLVFSNHISTQLRPPVPPKTSVVTKTCSDLQGSRVLVPLPSQQLFEISQSSSDPFFPSVQAAGSIQCGGDQSKLEARSLNSLSFNRNISSQTYDSTQNEYSPYSRPPSQRPSHHPPYYTRKGRESSTPRRPLTPHSNPLPAPQLAQPIPSPISRTRQQNFVVYKDSTYPHLPNLHQEPPSTRAYSPLQSVNRELRNEYARELHDLEYPRLEYPCLEHPHQEYPHITISDTSRSIATLLSPHYQNGNPLFF